MSRDVSTDNLDMGHVAALLVALLAVLTTSLSGMGLAPWTVDEGLDRANCPPGLVFEPPGERVEIRLVLPDGSLSDPILKYIEQPNSAAALSATLLPPKFISVAPRSVRRSARATDLHVTGERLRGVQSVAVLIGLNRWISLPATNQTDTSLTVKLPASLASEARFLPIAPTDDERQAIAFLVADPTLPRPGTSSAVRITSVSDVEVGPGGSRVITGSGFTSAGVALLGRDGGIELPTEMVSDNELRVELPESFVGLANDLYIAVATKSRRTASSSFAVMSTKSDNALDYSTIYGNAVTMGGVLGTLIWKDGDQDLLVDGLRLAPGMEFELTSQGKTRRVRKVATRWEGAPSIDPQLARVKITFALDELWPTTGCVTAPPR